GEHAYRAGGDARFATNGGGKFHLIAGAQGNFHAGDGAATGGVDQINSDGFEALGKLNTLRKVPAALFPVGRGDADKYRPFCGPDFADGLRHAQRKTGAIVEAAAVIIGAKIRERREEFVSEIAVGGMDFDHLEASGQGAMRGRSKIIDDLIDFGDGEFFRVGIVWIKRDRAGSNRNPAAIGYCDFVPAEPGRGGAALSAGVGELHAGDGALFADEVGNW